jgi:hypothetical protein
MKRTPIIRIIPALVAASTLLPFAIAQTPAHARPPADPPPPKITLRDPCARDPNNVVQNGSMAPGHDTQYGSLANGWEPFIFDGAPPQFRWVGNEQIDPEGSQQIFSSNTFDAGIYQTVRNLQPGMYYTFRLGYSLAAKSYSGPNVRVDSIGRKVGVDPFGGTDPKSPNVIWGPDLFDGNAALNRPEMVMVFAARAPNATIFLRAMARDGSGGENRVWLDAVCMNGMPDYPFATPLPPTATPVPPTATARPPATRPPATRAAQATATPIPPAATSTPPNTPTPAITAAPTWTPRYARPTPTPVPEPIVNPASGAMAGTGTLFIFLGTLSLGIGIRLLGRID